MFKIEKMICKVCGDKKIKTDDGICLICRPRTRIGTEVKQEVNQNDYTRGIISKSKSGKIGEK